MNRRLLPATDGGGTRVEFQKQLLLRFALTSADSTTAVVEDCLPPALCLRVNGKLCQLPPVLPSSRAERTLKEAAGGGAFRPSRPVDITSLTKFSPVVANQLSITWTQPTLPFAGGGSFLDYSRRFVASLILVSRLSPDDLVARIRAKGTKSADFTRSIIRDKLRDEDAEIATTCLRASLLCPVCPVCSRETRTHAPVPQLAKVRLRYPGRATSCRHIQCFDLHSFLQMNERKPTWVSPSLPLSVRLPLTPSFPRDRSVQVSESRLESRASDEEFVSRAVCDSRVRYADLVIDGLFSEILAADRALAHSEVQFDEVNGQIEWTPIVAAGASAGKRRLEPEPPPVSAKKSCPQEIITLSDDSSDEGGARVSGDRLHVACRASLTRSRLQVSRSLTATTLTTLRSSSKVREGNGRWRWSRAEESG